MLVFLGGPIDMAGEHASHWRQTAKEMLKEHGISTYDPLAAFNVNLHSKAAVERLVQINMHALSQCHFAIFALPHYVPTFGTPMELFYAHQNDIPHVVWWDGDPAKVPAYVTYCARKIVYTLEDAVNAAVNHVVKGTVNFGKVKL